MASLPTLMISRAVPLRVIPNDAIGAPWPGRAVSTGRRVVDDADERGHGAAALHANRCAA